MQVYRVSCERLDGCWLTESGWRTRNDDMYGALCVHDWKNSILANGIARAWPADGGGRRILNGITNGAGIGAFERNRPMCNGREPKQNIMRIRSSRLVNASGCFFFVLFSLRFQTKHWDLRLCRHNMFGRNKCVNVGWWAIQIYLSMSNSHV